MKNSLSWRRVEARRCIARAQRGRAEVVRLLLAAGALTVYLFTTNYSVSITVYLFTTNQPSIHHQLAPQGGGTPLHRAAQRGRVLVVRLLLAAGALTVYLSPGTLIVYLGKSCPWKTRFKLFRDVGGRGEGRRCTARHSGRGRRWCDCCLMRGQTRQSPSIHHTSHPFTIPAIYSPLCSGSLVAGGRHAPASRGTAGAGGGGAAAACGWGRRHSCDAGER